jgi:virulence-associated protein VapD
MNRKVYSLNKLAWLISAGADVKLVLDNNNKCYGIVQDDVSSLLEEYKNNKELHKFLNAYKDIRKFMKENKNIK